MKSRRDFNRSHTLLPRHGGKESRRTSSPQGRWKIYTPRERHHRSRDTLTMLRATVRETVLETNVATMRLSGLLHAPLTATRTRGRDQKSNLLQANSTRPVEENESLKEKLRASSFLKERVPIAQPMPLQRWGR